MTRPSQRQRQLVRDFVEANMWAQIEILRGERGSFNETTGKLGGMANATTIYEGKARIRNINGAGVILVGEENVDTATTLISIPWGEVIPRRNDLVHVLGDDSADAEPDGQWFRVLDYESGGLFGEARRMSCVVWRDSSRWSRP